MKYRYDFIENKFVCNDDFVLKDFGPDMDFEEAWERWRRSTDRLRDEKWSPMARIMARLLWD